MSSSNFVKGFGWQKIKIKNGVIMTNEAQEIANFYQSAANEGYTINFNDLAKEDLDKMLNQRFKCKRNLSGRIFVTEKDRKEHSMLLIRIASGQFYLVERKNSRKGFPLYGNTFAAKPNIN